MSRVCEKCEKEFEGPVRRNMCHACYCRATYVRLDRPAKCHPERKAYRKGLCSVCYKAQKNTGQATCHPDKPVHSKGLCGNCYIKSWTTPEYRKNQNSRPQSVAARKSYASTEAGKIARAKSVTKCDPDGSRMAARLRKSYELHRSERLDPARVRLSNMRRRKTSPEDYNRKLESQGGKCAICKGADHGGYRGKDGLGGRFATDHDHETDENRGLLCMHCNQALGKFQDSPKILQAAIDYLNLYGKPSLDLGK